MDADFNYYFCLQNEPCLAKTCNEVKPKNSLSKSNPNISCVTPKSKKSKPNINRIESSVTANGTVGVAPKKPINPYLLFCQENRSSLQEKYQMKHNVMRYEY